MDIKYRLYPHPVLSLGTDDYVDSEFSFTAEVCKGVRELSFTFTFALKDLLLSELVAQGFVEFLLHIECPRTCYREIIRTSKMRCERRILEKELNGKVSVCAFLIAKRDIVEYRNPHFNSDYGQTAFSIDKGGIMGIAGQLDVTVTKDVEELAKIPSIFTICKYAVDNDDYMAFDYDGDKIVIKLSETGFGNYKAMVNMPSMLTATYSMLIVPALIYVFEIMKQADDLLEFETHRWFFAIRKTLQAHSLELNKELLERIPSFELAQRLLDSPVNRAMEAIVDLDIASDEEQ